MKISNRYKIGILNGSTTCEPSGYLFNKIIVFLGVNEYTVHFDKPEDCQIILINTCCVTKGRMSFTERLIEKSLQSKSIKFIIIFGCYAGFAEKIKKDKRIITIGSRQMNKIDEVFAHRVSMDNIATSSLDHRIFIPYQSKLTANDYFVLISQGCTHNCSYCNIKKAKGYVVSRSPESIIKDIQAGVRDGNSEFVLLADDCGSYGNDIGTNLVNLINEILSKFNNIKIKISSLFPADFLRFYSDLSAVIASGKISYLNIPLQSGSRRILRLMNRDYNINVIMKRIKVIKEKSPDTWLYTHILANFPTETMVDYRKSLKVAELFDEFLIITYSDNPLTIASKIAPKVNRAEQEKRLEMANRIVSQKKCGLVVGLNTSSS